MRIYPIPVFALISLWVMAPASAADPVEPGEYVTEGGLAHLSVMQDGPDERRFEIHAFGENRHTCDLGGKIEAGLGLATDEVFAPCALAFVKTSDAIRVSASDSTSDNAQNCRSYCGMRAAFDGTYRRLPLPCHSAKKHQSIDAYLRLYRAKQYAEALEVLQSFEAQCEKFLPVLDELDRVRNDVAITLHHLGDDKACLRELDRTLAATVDGEVDLRQAMANAPADFELYLPVAKSTWTNRKICNG